MSAHEEIYLDNSATTRPYPEVVDLVAKTMLHCYGNPSSLHRKGIEAETAVNQARQQIARALGVSREEILFTSGGTEANNLALVGAARASRGRGNHIICSAIEHPSALEVVKRLGKSGFAIDFCPVDRQGKVDPVGLAGLIREETILVSVMMVNNEIGTIEPIRELVQACRTRSPYILFHSDCVQAFGKIEVLPRHLGVDLLTISSHKIHGPKGVGALYLARGTQIENLVEGGGQERKLRSGTENVPGIVGFGLAARLATDHLARMGELVELKKHLLARLDEWGIEYRVNGPPVGEGAPHILNLSFPGLRGEVLVHCLEGDGIYVSTGSACSSRQTRTSHVLEAIGLGKREAEGSIRVSFSLLNNLSQVERLAESLVRAVHRLQPLRG